MADRKEAENKVSDNNNNNQGVVDQSLADREAEDSERQARELKAGLHPLRVPCALSLSLCGIRDLVLSAMESIGVVMV